jgi:Flp pilus assembly protein TadD
VTAVLTGIVATRATVRDWMTDETLYLAARRNVPEAPRASATLAKLRLEQGRVEEAMALIDETLRLWPEQSGALVDRGLVLVRSERFEEAAVAFRAACRVNPYNETAAVSLGLALARLDRLDDAEHALRAAVRRFPKQSKAWVELGNVLDRLGRPAEAIAAWRTAQALGRDDLAPRIREREARLAGAAESRPLR